jgi:hypothetical protein
VYESRDKEREYRYNQNDLAAQRKSALWAHIMGLAAVVGMALSALGVWLVKTTFDEARKSNDIARESMERQLRAYISLELIEPINIGVDMRIICPIYVKNYGQTPAYDFQIVANFVAGGKAIEWQADVRDLHLAKDLMPNSITIHPGICTSSEATSEWELTQSIFNQFIDGSVIILAMVKATYRDAFGHDRYTTMQFRFATANDNRPQRSTFGKTGNYAT